MGNLIEQQAIDFSNVPIIQRDVKASVHLEDWEDVLYWDTVIQRVSPGRYNYLAHSKADNGHLASGSSQCLKYMGYMSKLFFVCIDSDMNYSSLQVDFENQILNASVPSEDSYWEIERSTDDLRQILR